MHAYARSPRSGKGELADRATPPLRPLRPPSTIATTTLRARKLERRRAQLEESVTRYLQQLDTADRQEPSGALVAKTAHLKEKLAKLESEMQRLAAMEKQMLASPDQQVATMSLGKAQLAGAPMR